MSDWAAVNDIDWMAFDQYPESTCTCRCGSTFRSHAKVVALADGGLITVTRRDCPRCGSTTRCRGIESDPETWET